MNIKLDFSEVSAPTAKQIDLVQEICRVLRLGKPEYTFESYSDFISTYIDDFKEYIDNQTIDIDLDENSYFGNRGWEGGR